MESRIQSFKELPVGSVFFWLPRTTSPGISPGSGGFVKVSPRQARDRESHVLQDFEPNELVLSRGEKSAAPRA